MSMQLKERTKAFAVRVIRMVREVKTGKVEDIVVRQVVRSATSVAANYRSALRARSTADFISKITIAEEEADETCYWLELMMEIGFFASGRLDLLLREAREITAILTTSGKTAKLNSRKHQGK